jgi:soluble P-type ATPase
VEWQGGHPAERTITEAQDHTVMRIDMPDGSHLRLDTLILDINGTLTRDGKLLAGVQSRLAELRRRLRVTLVTRDTLGSGSEVARELGVEIDRVLDGNKMTVIDSLDPETAVMIGNGLSDVEALRRCRVGIAVIGPEGCSTQALLAADIVVAAITDALDLLLTPVRLVSTLRR